MLALFRTRKQRTKYLGWSLRVYSNSSQKHYFTMVIWQQELWTKNLDMDTFDEQRTSVPMVKASIWKRTQTSDFWWTLIFLLIIMRQSDYFCFFLAYGSWLPFITFKLAQRLKDFDSLCLLFKLHNRHSPCIIYII